MYSQKLNCVASLFAKRNYNVLSPHDHIHVSVSVLYIPRIDLPICCSQKADQPWEYINHSQTHFGIGKEAAQFHVWE
jgi:hypothetical protein